MNTKKLICISCPIGCRLTVDKELNVTGNKCPRGITYAHNELKDPRRIVTAVVKSDSKELPFLPVRTNEPLPKKLINPLLNKLHKLTVTGPVKCGDVLIEDFENSKISVIFTGDSL